QRAQGIPFPELGTWYLILGHGLGGICLVLGVLVRWAALVDIPLMAGALFFVHIKQGFFIGKEGGYEYVLLVLGATVAQTLLGAGAFTLRKWPLADVAGGRLSRKRPRPPRALRRQLRSTQTASSCAPRSREFFGA